MLFQATPDTSAYMIGGYAFAFVAMAIYLISLIVRGRNLQQDLSILQGMEQEVQAKEVKFTTQQ